MYIKMLIPQEKENQRQEAESIFIPLFKLIYPHFWHYFLNFNVKSCGYVREYRAQIYAKHALSWWVIVLDRSISSGETLKLNSYLWPDNEHSEDFYETTEFVYDVTKENFAKAFTLIVQHLKNQELTLPFGMTIANGQVTKK